MMVKSYDKQVADLLKTAVQLDVENERLKRQVKGYKEALDVFLDIFTPHMGENGVAENVYDCARRFEQIGSLARESGSLATENWELGQENQQLRLIIPNLRHDLEEVLRRLENNYK